MIYGTARRAADFPVQGDDALIERVEEQFEGRALGEVHPTGEGTRVEVEDFAIGRIVQEGGEMRADIRGNIVALQPGYSRLKTWATTEQLKHEASYRTARTSAASTHPFLVRAFLPSGSAPPKTIEQRQPGRYRPQTDGGRRQQQNIQRPILGHLRPRDHAPLDEEHVRQRNRPAEDQPRRQGSEFEAE